MHFKWIALIAIVSTTFSAHAESPLDPRTRRAILDCTFEVLSYLRNAQGHPLMWISGSAYCLGDGTLVSAAHVFDPSLGGRFEAPVLRDRKGRIYSVDRVLRYSMPDDFIVFTAIGLETRRAPPRSDSVTERLHLAWRREDRDLAVTDAEFRGRTTLEKYGRDGWIQLIPSPGHGSSGGGVLDDRGRLLGIIQGQSNESVDAIAYAIPIAHIEAAPTTEAVIALSDPMSLLDMRSMRNEPMSGEVRLPAVYSNFVHDLMQARETYFADMLPYSLSLEGEDAPLSDEQRRALCVELGDTYCGRPRLEIARHDAQSSQRCVLAWSGVGAALIRCSARDLRAQAQAIAMGRDETQRGISACRPSEPLGDQIGDDSFIDTAGAKWRIRSWPTSGCDWTVIAMSRATANGMLAFVRGAPSGYANAAAMQLKTLTNLQCRACTDETSQAVVIAAATD